MSPQYQRMVIAVTLSETSTRSHGRGLVDIRLTRPFRKLKLNGMMAKITRYHRILSCRGNSYAVMTRCVAWSGF